MSQRLKSRFTVYQFLVRLRGFRPTIWRRLRVADCTLDGLHDAIQVTFGLPVGEPFEFIRREPEWDRAGERCRHQPPEAWLSKILPLDGSDFRLWYQAGYGELCHGELYHGELCHGKRWRYQVEFEGWILSSFDGLYPYCVEGERAGPPNAEMGPGAFRQWLKAWNVPDQWSMDRHLAWTPHDPAVIELDAINDNLQRLARSKRPDDDWEPLIRISLTDEEWQLFWDFAPVDDDERDRMMTTSWREAVWLYLPEAVNTARNLIMAANQAESSEARDLLDRLVGRLYRNVVFHRLRNARRPSLPHGGDPGSLKAESDAQTAQRD